MQTCFFQITTLYCSECVKLVSIKVRKITKNMLPKRKPHHSGFVVVNVFLYSKLAAETFYTAMHENNKRKSFANIKTKLDLYSVAGVHILNK